MWLRTLFESFKHIIPPELILPQQFFAELPYEATRLLDVKQAPN